VVASWTGIPVTQMMETEAEKLLQMEERLHERIIGQNRAIEALSDAIRRSRSGLSDPRRPIGSFIFLGSSGVGKTELAKALAEFLFDDEDALIRVDMSEYREQHTVSRLFGAPPGYVGYDQGGQLTEQVRRRPYSVVLFDEIEKAHPDVWNALLQLLDDGRLTDGQGRVVNFRNTVIVMTSNVGTSFVKKSGALGFGGMADDEDKADHKRISDALKKTFRPEFINRIDETIIFEPLSEEDVMEIVNLQMKDVQERLSEHGGLAIELTESAQKWLAAQGYDKDFGARPLKRALQRFVESPLSVRLLKGEFAAGDRIRIDEVDNELTFTRLESAPPIPVAEESEPAETA
jgi:ATP-dependent Clp protease ATP-binding subunit ClpC